MITDPELAELAKGLTEWERLNMARELAAMVVQLTFLEKKSPVAVPIKMKMPRSQKSRWN